MTHPHRGHITKEYDYNISILLNEVLKKNNYKKILFYNFQQKINFMLKEKNLDELMLADDIASHPTKKYYKELANQIIILIEDLT